jgi:hypothetical protein
MEADQNHPLTGQRRATERRGSRFQRSNSHQDAFKSLNVFVFMEWLKIHQTDMKGCKAGFFASRKSPCPQTYPQ